MAFLIDEEEVWKCSEHPSKRRKGGVCPICLRDRLIPLCPDCAHLRPCSCYASTSSSSSSFFEPTGRISNFMDVETPLRRSISMSIPFLRSKSRFMDDDRRSRPDVGQYSPVKRPCRSGTSFWSLFKNTKKAAVLVGDRNKAEVGDALEQTDSSSIIGKSRMAGKGKGWYFPTPIKAFRQSKLPKIVQERSPVRNRA